MGQAAPEPVGVLLAQLGTPDAPTTGALRRYLAEFLADPRVVDLPRPLWWFILHGIILRVRPRRSAALYRNIWMEEGSPLLVHSRRQEAGLRTRLETRYPGRCRVALGMRYGSPSLTAAIDQLISKGCTRILLFPLYPQYSVATTASVMDRVYAHVLDRVHAPTLRVVPPFPDHPAYISALATGVREAYEALPERPEKLLISFHGEPESYREAGDPYQDHCHRTARALTQKLDLPADEVGCVFQSRFGNAPWLQPYLDATLTELGQLAVKRIAVTMPGFTADCLETLDEVGREGLKTFQAAGGAELTAVPCLNDHPAWLDAMGQIAGDQLQGWI